jgi:hypothetical protein
LTTPSLEEVAANFPKWQAFQETLFNGMANTAIRSLAMDKKVLEGLTEMLDFIHDNRRVLAEAGVLPGLMARLNGIVTLFLSGHEAYQDLFKAMTEAYHRARR